MYQYYKSKRDLLKKIDNLSNTIDTLIGILDSVDKGENKNKLQDRLEKVCDTYNDTQTTINLLKSDVLSLYSELYTKDLIIQKYVKYYVNNEIDFLEKGDNNEK